MALQDELIAIERGFWPGDAAYYREHLDAQCLVVFTEMAGVHSRDDVANMVKDGQRWTDLKIEPKGLIRPATDVAILSYEAVGTHPNGQPYKANVSTGYQRRDGQWKMMFHQQTPLPAGE